MVIINGVAPPAENRELEPF